MNISCLERCASHTQFLAQGWLRLRPCTIVCVDLLRWSRCLNLCDEGLTPRCNQSNATAGPYDHHPGQSEQQHPICTQCRTARPWQLCWYAPDV